MRKLTFKGFLTQYVKRLSTQATTSLHKLAAEASNDNPRLREPLLLYAMFARKQDILLAATKDTRLHQEYSDLVSRYSAEQMESILKEESPFLAEEYHKVWRSYLSRKNRLQADNHTKELIRNKVKRLQEKNGVTNYRIYTDLRLNPGNLNAWLKYGDCDKVSLNTARMILHYVEGFDSAQQANLLVDDSASI